MPRKSVQPDFLGILFLLKRNLTDYGIKENDLYARRKESFLRKM